MPSLFRVRGFRFFFYSNEGNPTEPAHVHVEKGGVEAKFWIGPEVHLAYNDGFNARELRELSRLVAANSGRIERMTSSASPTGVRFDRDSMWVTLSDGRVLGVPLAWFPRLMHGSREQREACRLTSRGMHWMRMSRWRDCLRGWAIRLGR